MWSPFFRCDTSLPTSMTVPAPSWPRTMPGIIGTYPFLIERSEWHTPLAPSWTTTSRGPGGAGSRSSIASGPPVSTKTAARIAAPLWMSRIRQPTYRVTVSGRRPGGARKLATAATGLLAYDSRVLRVAYFGPAGTFTEEALLTQPDLAAGTRTPHGSVPEVIARGRAGRRRRRGRADREHDRGLGVGHPRHARLRQRAPDPAGDRPARCRSTCARRRAWRSPTSGPSCRSRTRSRSAGAGSPRSCPAAETQGVALHLRCGAGGLPLQAPRPRRDLQRARPPSSTASRCSPPTSRTTRRTRRASCSSAAGIPAPTGHDKTSIVCFQRRDRPGSLLGILQEFAARDVNLTKLESRPDQAGPRRLLLLHRLRGPRRRRGGRRRAAQPLGQARRREVPRLVPGRRTGRGRACERRKAVGKAWKKASAWVDGLRAQIREGDDVIDLKRLRDEPEYRRGIERKRVRAGLVDEVLAADEAHRRARHRGRRAAGRAERGVEGDRQGRARRAPGQDRARPPS